MLITIICNDCFNCGLLSSMLSCYAAGERDRDGDRERESSFRFRDRRWLESALRDSGVSGLSSSDKPENLVTSAKKEPVVQLQKSPLMFGEELEFWSDKVRMIYTNWVIIKNGERCKSSKIYWWNIWHLYKVIVTELGFYE